MASSYVPQFGDPDKMRALVAQNVPENQLAALPEQLSPSRASSFKKCPQAFFYETICKIRTPGSTATLRGTLMHACAERIFDHEPQERTVDVALGYLLPAWDNILNPDVSEMDEAAAAYALADAQEARKIAPEGSPEERTLLFEAAECVRSWFEMERIANFTPPRDVVLENGKTISDGRELYVRADLSGLVVHGYVDRLDSFETADGQTVWSVSDYKTSAAVPWKKKNYGAAMEASIKKDAFFQLLVYAVALYYMLGIKVGMLRLVYVATGNRQDGIGIEYVNEQMIEATITELQNLWSQIQASARTGKWETKKQKLCDWCYFKPICPAWNQEPDGSEPVSVD